MQTRGKRSGRIVGLGVLVALSLVAPGEARSATRIGIVFDGPAEQNEEIRRYLHDEILELTQGEFEIEFPDDADVTCDWTPEMVESTVAGFLGDDRIDMIIGAGPLSTHSLATGGPLPKPCFAPFVLSRLLQGFPFDQGVSGVSNLSYVEPTNNLGNDVEVFRAVAPFTRLAFLGGQPIFDLVPGLRESIEAAGVAIGIDVTAVPVGDRAADALGALPDDVEAVYLTPLPQLAPGEFELLIQGLIERELPSFAFLGRPDVERGVLVGDKPTGYFERLARRVALNIQATLLGEDPGTLPISFTTKSRLMINMATARAIGHYPSFAALTEAELIDNQARRIDRVLSLGDVVSQAMAQNLDLAAKEREVAAGQQDIPQTRAGLLPQIFLRGDAVARDPDAARAGLGSSPERKVSGSASLFQSIYEDRTWAEYSVAKNSQHALEFDRDALRLDVVLEAAGGYLDVLIAKTLERVVRHNLELTRSNLELARVRQDIGISSPAEVYRWESQMAQARIEVINANANRNLAEIQVNRVLNRPLEESFLTVETTIDDPSLITSDPRLTPYFADPWSFKVFRRYAVQLAFERAPELKQINALIAVQQRILTSGTRAFFLPDFRLDGAVEHRFYEDGEGTSDVRPPELPPINDTTWRMAAIAEFPLFTSGDRPARRQQAKQTLLDLRIQQDAVRLRVEQRVRSAMHVAGASYAAIALSQAAADAADRNLDLVTDSYARGVDTIITLLDAQNNAVTADFEAANATYAFLFDLMEVERAVGSFTFFATEERIDAFFDGLGQYRRQAASE